MLLKLYEFIEEEQKKSGGDGKKGDSKEFFKIFDDIRKKMNDSTKKIDEDSVSEVACIS